MTKVEVFEEINKVMRDPLRSKEFTDILFTDGLSEEDKHFKMYADLRLVGFSAERANTTANQFLALPGTVVEPPPDEPPVDPEV